MENDIQMVDFKKYCKTCKYEKTKEIKDPCNECLDVGAREGTCRPERWEAKD